MPKKKRQETQAEQSARFKRDAQRLIDAGELNPTEADERLKQILKAVAPTRLSKPNSDA